MRSNSIRVGLVGRRHCASSLVQGLTFYRDAKEDEPVPGADATSLGGYHVGDIEVSAAFDVTASKVGRDVRRPSSPLPTTRSALRMFPPPACSSSAAGRSTASAAICARRSRNPMRPPPTSRRSCGGPRRTCSSPIFRSVPKSPRAGMRSRRLPPAAVSSTAFPFSSPRTRRGSAIRRARLPLIGDDIKSQVGADHLHRLLANLFRDRGCA